MKTYAMSQSKMVALSYTFQPPAGKHTDVLSVSVSPASNLDVIIRRDSIPFTFDKLKADITTQDDTITLTLPSATAGTYYLRVIADTSIKEIQASVRVGKPAQAPTAVPTPIPTPVPVPTPAPVDGGNNQNPVGGNNLFLILITVFLGLLVIILSVIVVVFVLRGRQTTQAEMTNIGGDSAKYSLLAEEKA